MNEIKRKWLAIENWVAINQRFLWFALWFAFFFIFPFFVTEKIDFDAISAHLP